MRHPAENKLCEDLRREEEQMKAKRARLGPKVDENQQLIDQMLKRTQKFPSRQKQLDNFLVDMLAQDLQPASIIEDKGFVKFIKILRLSL